MKKEEYVKPMIRVHIIEATNLLSVSGTENDYADPNDDPGELYDQIEFGEGYCKYPD